MNTQFIQKIFIDWNKIHPYSYLRNIEAIAGLESLDFHKPITFFVGENGSGKSTMLEADCPAAIKAKQFILSRRA